MDVLSRSLRQLPMQDAMRRSGARVGGARDWKEWHHFVVHEPGRHLIINFSLLDDPRATGRASAEVARVIVLVRMERWVGVVERVSEVRGSGTGLDMRFGQSRLWFEGGQYHVALNLDAGRITARLRMKPTSAPLTPANLVLCPGRVLSWLFVPRLETYGELYVEGRRARFMGTESYHDHNWGRYLWGEDFSWDWMSILPESSSSPWSVVAMRVMDRGRHVVRYQAMFVYRGARLHALYQDQQVNFHAEGALAARAGLVMPPVMKLLASGRSVGLPERITAEGCRGQDWLRVHFLGADLAQVIVPDELGGSGYTTLNEVFGGARLEGCLAGESIELEGPGIYEHVQGAMSPAPGSEPAPQCGPRSALGGVAGRVVRSLCALARESPGAYLCLEGWLRQLTVRVLVDEESFVLRCEGAGLDVRRSGEAARVHVLTSTSCILQVLAGVLTIEEAIEQRRLLVKGALDDLVRVERALRAYVEGALRAPSFPGLLEEFQAAHGGVEPTPGPSPGAIT